jgi:hypothetical protein
MARRYKQSEISEMNEPGIVPDGVSLSMEHPNRRLTKSEIEAIEREAVNLQSTELEKSGIKHSAIKSVMIDAWNLPDFLGSRTKPSRCTYQILRRMAISCKPVAAIIQVRQNQIASFTQLTRKPGDIGFRITTKDPHKVPSESERRRIDELQEFILNTGLPNTKQDLYKGIDRQDNFDMFMRKLVRDTLTLDATCFEIQRRVNGKPFAVWPIDAATIKFASEEVEFNPVTGKQKVKPLSYTNGLPVKYVQELIHGRVVAQYNRDEMVYDVMNPRTDMDIFGYGLSPLEILMETVTAILFGEQYNMKYFTQNAIPQGVLNIAGKYTPEAMEAFKRAWIAQVSGVANAWRVPVMAIDEKGGGVNFVPFKQNNKDMEFHLWIEYLIQTACAIFCIDPSEVGYLIKGGGSAPLMEHSGKVKLDFSKDKGLWPLMKFYQHLINKHIVQRLYTDLYFEWVGADAMPEADKIDITSKKIQAGLMTVNEARALEDMPRINQAWADAPAHAVLAQVFLKDQERADAKEQQEREAEQQAEQPPAEQGAEGGQQSKPAGGSPAPQGGGKNAGTPQQGTQPAIPAPEGVEQKPVIPNEGKAEDYGVDMPFRTRRGKDKSSPEYAEARENEKERLAKRREKEHLGVNSVHKSQGGILDDGIEVVEIDSEGEEVLVEIN